MNTPAAIRLFSLAALGGAALGWLGAQSTLPVAAPSAGLEEALDKYETSDVFVHELGRLVLVRGTRALAVESYARPALLEPVPAPRRSPISAPPAPFGDTPIPAPLTAGPAASNPLPDPSSAEAGALVVEVGPGIALPAAFLPGDETLSPEQARLKDDIAQEFERELASALSEQTAAPLQIEDIYSAAKVRADERFRMLFGDAAYAQWTAQAAFEALPLPEENR